MHIHILAIGGLGTASLAAELKRLGHVISGSDQDKIFPPVTDILQRAHITINRHHITPSIDFAIIGPAFKYFTRTKEEYEQILKHKIPHQSFAEYLGQNVAKPQSIIVAGSYGKTTISSLISWILQKDYKDPSFMYAGLNIDNSNSVHLSQSEWSVLEGDEAINGLDTKAKFLYYPVKYLLLTSADWEHKEAYPTSAHNFRAFKKLILNVPSTGLLVINLQGVDTKKLASFSNARVITYNGQDAHYQIAKTTNSKSKTILHTITPNGNFKIKTSLIGDYNHQNILGAFALANEIGIKPSQICHAIESFPGVKRRLEIIPQKSHIVFIDDMAQSATRISAALQAVRKHFPSRQIKVFFEPHATFLQYKNGLIGLRQAFQFAQEIVLGQIPFKDIPRASRATFCDFQAELGSKIRYIPVYKDLIDHFKQTINPSDVLIHFSSGGLDGTNAFYQIINHFSKK